MTAKIKFTCEFTTSDIDYMPDAEQARKAFEGLFIEWLPVIFDEFTITEYEQEYIDES